MDLTPLPEFTNDQHRATQIYVESQVMEKLADAQRAQQEAIAPQAQADE